jgi:hypothetical protein
MTSEEPAVTPTVRVEDSFLGGIVAIPRAASLEVRVIVNGTHMIG